VPRSAHEIGGNCIEVVASGGSRLLLDIGRPLDGEGEAATLLPATLDLGDLPAALLISHPHQDHYGLLQAAPASWSVHSGAASVRFSVAGCKAKSPDAMGHLRRPHVSDSRSTPKRRHLHQHWLASEWAEAKLTTVYSITSSARNPAPHRPALGEVVTTSGEGRCTPSSSCVTRGLMRRSQPPRRRYFVLGTPQGIGTQLNRV
jgi:hypothetical protein